MIQISGSHLQHIITNVLMFSQLEANKIAISQEPFDIAALINRTAFSRLAEAQDKGLSLQMDIDPSLPITRIGDAKRVSQVLKALLDNAVKFTDSGSILIRLIRETSSTHPGALRLEVHDTGPGIAADHCKRIFERFTQVDGSIKRLHGGTGLGLTVAKGLTERMGGRLNVQSQPGAGSVFTCELDLPPFAASSLDIPAARETKAA